MVIMASGIARGSVRTTTTTAELPNMAAIQKKGHLKEGLLTKWLDIGWLLFFFRVFMDRDTL